MYAFYRDENDSSKLTDLNSNILDNQVLNIIGGRRGRGRRSSSSRSMSPISRSSIRSISPISRYVTYISRPVAYYRPVVVSYLYRKYKTKYEKYIETLGKARTHYNSAVNALTPVANAVNLMAENTVQNIATILNGLQVTHNGVATEVTNARSFKRNSISHIDFDLANGVNNAHLATITINPVARFTITLDMITNFNNHINLCRSELASLEALDHNNITSVLIASDMVNQYRVTANNFPYYTVARKNDGGNVNVQHVLAIDLVKKY